MFSNSLGVVILAAGKGSRMNSDQAKVLHSVNGRSMISSVVGCAFNAFRNNIVVVIGHQWEKVKADVVKNFDVSFALQKNMLGTADAVKTALPYLTTHIKHVLILCGDVPLIREKTLISVAEEHLKSKNDVTVLVVHVNDPKGYGRIITDTGGNLIGIREELDASEDEKKIKRINTGIYCIERKFLDRALDLIGKDNVQKEYYLTEVVEIAVRLCKKNGYIMGHDPREVVGVNTKEDLKVVERLGKTMDIEFT